MRFYLVDRITEMTLGETIKGIKCWTMSEDFFNDHFPGFPIVPGVLAIESAAQLLGTLLEKSHSATFGEENGAYAVLSIIHKAKFKGFMLPGDQAIMEGKLTSMDKQHGSGTIKTTVDGKIINNIELSFALIPMKELANPRLVEMRNEYFRVLTEATEKRNQSSR